MWLSSIEFSIETGGLAETLDARVESDHSIVDPVSKPFASGYIAIDSKDGAVG
jgi:hypothetical protein